MMLRRYKDILLQLALAYERVVRKVKVDGNNISFLVNLSIIFKNREII